MTDSLSDVNDILGVFLIDAIQQCLEPMYLCLDERNSGIGQGRAKSYMDGFLEELLKTRPERVGEGSTIVGKLF